MREIKFRAWVKDATTGERMCNRVRWLDLDNQRICTESGMQPDEFILMQYTGLKDKNGREIYEGDILIGKERELICVVTVVWDRSGYWTYKGYSKELRGGYLTDLRRVEVIGNIYENPELLE